MKASGYFAHLADFELFISEMTEEFTRESSTMKEQSMIPKGEVWFWQKKKTKVVPFNELRYILIQKNLLVLNNCYNLLLFNRGQGHVTVNIPVEATEMYFQWFKGKVDDYMVKH